MKVFWSWQDDYAPAQCRHFLRSCLVKAVANIAANHDVDDASRPSLDHDTKGAAGMVDIAQTILEKISGSAAFVADVTPTGKTTAGKFLPNPNVMIELGWAMQKPGLSQIIAILNLDSGCRIEELPFDIRHRRVMTYRLSADATTSQRNEVEAKLVSELTAALDQNLKSARRDQPAAQQTMYGVEYATADRSIWQGAGPTLKFIDSMRFAHAESSVILESGPRAYVRVIPKSWPDAQPSATELMNGNNKPFPYVSHAADGNYGLNEDGLLCYWITGKTDEGKATTHSVSMFFDQTGELWRIDGGCFYNAAGRMTFYLPPMLKALSKNAITAAKTLASLGASPKMRIEAGIVGLKGTTIQLGWRGGGLGRKDQVWVSEERSDWPDALLEHLLCPLANRTLDAFGLPKQSPAQIAELARKGEWP